MTRILFHAAVIAAAAIPASADTQDVPKTHTLFMGADIFVGKGDELYPVKDVSGSSWVVEVNGQRKVIPADEGLRNLRITPLLKLTEVSALVANLKSQRGYTFEKDPITMQERALANAASANSGYHAASNLANARSDATAHDSAVFSGPVNTNSRVPGPPGTDVQSTPAATAEQIGANATATSAGADLELTGDRSPPSGFDAMDVAFDISSERPLNSLYVVMVTRFHTPGGKPGTAQELTYAKALGPIDSRPKSVHLLEGGFPTGFELLDLQMHVYNRGQEIATNVSAKRVLLTRDEAFEYVKMEYFSDHKADTLSAAPAMGKLPADLPARLAKGKYRETIYVMVSKDGLPNELFRDAACSRKVDDRYLESVIKSIRFKPALKKGKPVDSVAPLKLGELAI